MTGVYITVAGSLTLAILRPRLWAGHRLPPVAAVGLGVVLVTALGALTPAKAGTALLELWRPYLTITCIMVMTDCARRVGLVDLWAARVEGESTTTRQRTGRRSWLPSNAASVHRSASSSVPPTGMRSLARAVPSGV